MTRIRDAVLFLALLALAGPAAADSPAASPYAGFQHRPIKALSDEQLADLRDGRGMMLSLPAELNGYPGPRHVLDMADGEADGVPLLPDAQQRHHWRGVIEAEYQTFCRWTDEGRDTVLDPYGATAIDEFFAVAVEAFFVASADMREEHPRLHALFAGYFKQDPTAQAR